MVNSGVGLKRLWRENHVSINRQTTFLFCYEKCFLILQHDDVVISHLYYVFINEGKPQNDS